MQPSLLTLTAGDAAATIDPQDGGRLTSLTVAGLELLGGVGDGVLDHGSFVMAPWAGRIRNGLLRVGERTHQLPTPRTHPHAGHGHVVDRPWTVLEADDRSATLRCDLDDRWPAPGHVSAEITLHGDRIEQQVGVHAADTAFPATIGWHPWFPRQLARGGPAEVTFDAEGMLRRDEAGIPDGTVVPVPPGPWDDCFVGVRWPVTISWPDAVELRIEADTHDLVIYDEIASTFCIEPQTGPPDGPNTAPRMVEPGNPLVATTVWSWS